MDGPAFLREISSHYEIASRSSSFLGNLVAGREQVSTNTPERAREVMSQINQRAHVVSVLVATHPELIEGEVHECVLKMQELVQRCKNNVEVIRGWYA